MLAKEALRSDTCANTWLSSRSHRHLRVLCDTARAHYYSDTHAPALECIIGLKTTPVAGATTGITTAGRHESTMRSGMADFAPFAATCPTFCCEPRFPGKSYGRISKLEAASKVFQREVSSSNRTSGASPFAEGRFTQHQKQFLLMSLTTTNRPSALLKTRPPCQG